jgi:hypothetical protein
MAERIGSCPLSGRAPVASGRQVCAGEGSLVDAKGFVFIDGTLLHHVGREYHRVSDGVRVKVKDGHIVGHRRTPIDPGASIRY